MRMFLPALLLLTIVANGQNERIVTDSHLKFKYTDSLGVTKSYVSYYGNKMTLPQLMKLDSAMITPDEWKGKTVVVNFWFIACSPCVKEIPALNRIAFKYASDSTVFLAVTFDSPFKIAKFLETKRFDFTLATLPEPEIRMIKKVMLYPFTAIIDRTGKISYVLFGRPARNPDEEIYQLLDRQMKKALAR